MLSLFSRKTPIQYREGASVYVRCVDEQRPELICAPLDWRELSLKHVPMDMRYAHAHILCLRRVHQIIRNKSFVRTKNSVEDN